MPPRDTQRAKQQQAQYYRNEDGHRVAPREIRKCYLRETRPGHHLNINDRENDIEILTVNIGSITITSVYKPPTRQFQFDNPDSLDYNNINVVIGDFNSHSTTWEYMARRFHIYSLNWRYLQLKCTYPQFNCRYLQIGLIVDIFKWIADISKWIVDIFKWIVDICNSIEDIYKSIEDIYKYSLFGDISNSIEDIFNSFGDIYNSFEDISK